ncbi:hypothetical protein [Legionella bozemanae]|uniref:Lipoprotein n=1 Tax=Legionella bozemanae TaxID=447 RepID=A0A0W0RJT3_LEGBO|nr:hypothetical protein [Legionella bozemanae]KTC71305.1 hypothetical protein Lboz_2882 [Legionella bozemanae]STO33441.1 Uncharacterised protein [Legionella bozemanae]
MKILKMLSLLMGVILAVSQLQGCAVAAIGAGIGAVKYANAKKAEAKEGCHKNYNEYLKVAKKPIPLSEYCSEK